MMSLMVRMSWCREALHANLICDVVRVDTGQTKGQHTKKREGYGGSSGAREVVEVLEHSSESDNKTRLKR